MLNNISSMDYGLISCQMVGKLRQPVDIELSMFMDNSIPYYVQKPIMVYKSATKLTLLANHRSLTCVIFKKLATVYGSTTQSAIFRASHALYL